MKGFAEGWLLQEVLIDGDSDNIDIGLPDSDGALLGVELA